MTKTFFYAKILKTGKDICNKLSCINYPFLGNKLSPKLEALNSKHVLPYSFYRSGIRKLS